MPKASPMYSTSSRSTIRRLGPPTAFFSERLTSVSPFHLRTSFVLKQGRPLVILAGSHLGCVEVVGGPRVKSTAELKGKTVAVSQLGSDEHIFTSMFAAYVGLDPRKDIKWIVRDWPEHLPLLQQGKIDALFTGPPMSQQLRAQG